MDIKEYKLKTENAKQNHPWEFARLEVVYDLLSKNLSKRGKLNSTNPLTILDVGCGDGFFLEQLSKRIPNADYIAVDTAFDDEFIEFFSKKYGSSNITFLSEMKPDFLQGKHIDVILLLDVIEHIEFDIDFLKGLSNLSGFDDETIIVITVPAYQSLFCSHDTWLGHYRRYTVKKLRNHLNQAGLKSQNDGYFFTSLLLPRLIQKMKELIIKPNLDNVAGIGDWKGSESSSRTIKNILVLDYKWSRFKRKFGIRLPGLSCFSICKKQS